MTFNKSFSFSLYGHLYSAYVEGFVHYDEHDRDVIYSVIDTIVVETAEGELVDDSHEDYDDIIQEVESRDYQPDFNW